MAFLDRVYVQRSNSPPVHAPRDIHNYLNELPPGGLTTMSGRGLGSPLSPPEESFHR